MKDWFPREKGPIEVVFDDEEKIRALTFHPYDPVVKENRIFGLGRWFSKRKVGEGDLISVTLEDLNRPLYRIALDRFVRERAEQRSQEKLRTAQTDSEAEQQLHTLLRLTGKRPREFARETLLRIAHESPRQRRPSIRSGGTARHEGVPSGIRVLLRELHDGKCQLCSFTFLKKSGDPYFEIHHLDPEVGHHPTNLLVVCPNCHAQLEHATLTDFEWAGNWLVGLAINNKRVAVRQPLARDSIARTLFVLGMVAAADQVGRLLIR